MIPYQAFNNIQIGPFQFYLYSLMILLAILIGIYMVMSEAKSKNIQYKKILNFYFLFILGVVIGARLFHFFDPAFILKNGFLDQLTNFFLFWKQGGLASYGGIIGGVTVMFLYAKKRFWEYSDMMAPFAALALFIGRIGCFFANDHPLGKTDSPLSLVLNGTSYHPAMIYASFTSLLILITLLILRERKPYEGYIAQWFLVLYPIARFFIDFTRNEPTYLGLSFAQYIMLIVLAFAIPLLIKNNQPAKKSKIRWKQYILLFLGGLIMDLSALFINTSYKTYMIITFILGLILFFEGIWRIYKYNSEGLSLMMKTGLIILILFILIQLAAFYFGFDIGLIGNTYCPYQIQNFCPA